MNDIERLEAEINRPNDPLKILADLHEESGNSVMATGYRKLAASGVRPYESPRDKQWRWLTVEKVSNEKRHIMRWIPVHLRSWPTQALALRSAAWALGMWEIPSKAKPRLDYIPPPGTGTTYATRFRWWRPAGPVKIRLSTGSREIPLGTLIPHPMGNWEMSPEPITEKQAGPWLPPDGLKPCPLRDFGNDYMAALRWLCRPFMHALVLEGEVWPQIQAKAEGGSP